MLLQSISLSRYFLALVFPQDSENSDRCSHNWVIKWSDGPVITLLCLALLVVTSVENISPTLADIVIIIRRCMCGAPVYSHTHTQRCTHSCTANSSSIKQRSANKSHLLWATILISQRCHSTTIPVCVRLRVCAVSTATSGGLRPRLSLWWW